MNPQEPNGCTWPATSSDAVGQRRRRPGKSAQVRALMEEATAPALDRWPCNEGRLEWSYSYEGDQA